MTNLNDRPTIALETAKRLIEVFERCEFPFKVEFGSTHTDSKTKTAAWIFISDDDLKLCNSFWTSLLDVARDNDFNLNDVAITTGTQKELDYCKEQARITLAIDAILSGQPQVSLEAVANFIPDPEAVARHNMVLQEIKDEQLNQISQN